MLICGQNFACSIEKIVPFIAFLADSCVLVKEFALGGDLAADAFFVEKVAI